MNIKKSQINCAIKTLLPLTKKKYYAPPIIGLH